MKKMKKFFVRLLVCFFLVVLKVIPRVIGGHFFWIYQDIVEYILIVIMTEKFTDWVFNDRSKDNEHD